VPAHAVRHDPGLSTRPGAKSWGEFFDLLRAVDVPDTFMAERPLNTLPPEHGLFDDERIPQPAAGR
jgi:antitoxin VapB